MVSPQPVKKMPLYQPQGVPTSVIFDHQQQRSFQGSASNDGFGFYNGPQHAPPYGGVPTGSSQAPYGMMNNARGYGGAPPARSDAAVSWLSAFGTGGIDGEAPLLEELDINLGHVRTKTIAVLNPMVPLERGLMEDTDLVGPLIFCLLFGMFLLFSGKSQFGYIYGVALLGWASIYTIVNLLSDVAIDTIRAASILGYCLLPMVFLSMISIAVNLQYERKRQLPPCSPRGASAFVAANARPSFML